MQQEDLVSESELEEMLNLYKGLLEEKRDELMHALTRESHAKHELEKLKRQIKVREKQENTICRHLTPFLLGLQTRTFCCHGRNAANWFSGRPWLSEGCCCFLRTWTSGAFATSRKDRYRRARRKGKEGGKKGGRKSYFCFIFRINVVFNVSRASRRWSARAVRLSTNGN